MNDKIINVNKSILKNRLNEIKMLQFRFFMISPIFFRIVYTDYTSYPDFKTCKIALLSSLFL